MGRRSSMASTNHNLEQTILRNIITDEKFMRKVLPFVKTEYFEGNYRLIFKQLAKYVSKYNRLPSEESLKIEIDEGSIVTEDRYTDVIQILPHVFKKESVDQEWLYERSEKWCQDRAIHIAIMDAIGIIDGKNETLTKSSIPALLQDALAVGFDTNIGHDYFEDADARFRAYLEDENRLAFDLDYFNRITNGGLVDKSLTVALAGTGVGKSLFMCHCAAAALASGHDVLYITMEMSEQKIAERIDANLLDVPIDQIESLPSSMLNDKVAKLKKNTSGNLIVKEYPTGQANTAHFRALLNDLKLKKRFKPQIVFIDYLNICASSRLKSMGGSVNSYTYIKAIAEEIRGLAVEFELPIVTATQTTRAGFNSSDPGLEDTSESFGLPATADLMFALISNEELEKDGQLMVKQLKNRYNDLNKYKKFLIGINRLHMRLFDLDQQAQNEIIQQVAPAGLPKPDKTKALTDASDYIF